MENVSSMNKFEKSMTEMGFFGHISFSINKVLNKYNEISFSYS